MAPLSSSATERTQVGIIGAGPAGLVLAARLAVAGVDFVVLEARSRDYVEARVRAGVLEAPTVRFLAELGVDARLRKEGLVHHGVHLQWRGQRQRIDFAQLSGQQVTVYGQQELVCDLIAWHLSAGRHVRFDTEVTTAEGILDPLPDRPGGGVVLGWRGPGGARGALACDVVAGCDGFHGVSRALAGPQRLVIRERAYPYAWLGVLADVAPSTDELIYAHHDRGFAMHSMRSNEVSRLYLQVRPDEDLRAWPDERIWSELRYRLAVPGWELTAGPIRERGITPMRSFVAEPMSHGRLFLAGDASHIVPPTGAKGLNLAVADVKVLGDALEGWYQGSSTTGLDGYSDRCLARVWRVQDFSTWMTTLLHVDPDGDAFERRLQRSRQDELVRSSSLAANLAENYTGLPLP